MSVSPPVSKPRFKSIPTIGILGAALVVVAALAIQAYRTEQAQRVTAERALRDYAEFAAWEFASNAKEEMWLAMTELLRPAEQLSPSPVGSRLPSPVIIAEQSKHITQCKQCAYEIPASYYFRIDLNDSALTTLLSEGPDGRAPDQVERQWIRDTIAGHAREVFAPHWRVATVVGEVAGKQLTVAYTVIRDTLGCAVAAYGVVSESKQFVAGFSAKIADWDLLPPTLSKQAAAKHLVSIIVRDGWKNVVYRSPWQYSDRYSASYRLTNFVAGFTVQASLRPDSADRLVVGQAGRFPILMTLLGITAVLVGVAFRQLRREAALARLRADFVSSVSHELRTPLSQIRMFAELLRMGWVRSEQERARSLEIIDQEAHRLSHLVEKVLRFEGAERGEYSLTAEPTHLAPVVREVLEAFAPIARARRVTIRQRLDETVVATVDRGALRQVLINLLDNAVKYGPDGQVVIVTLAGGDSGQNARLAIEDEGPGIPTGERDGIWEPFRRLARDANSAVAGSGIGLSVVKRLVEAHGGSVRVEDRESTRGGTGARFVVELPVPASAPAPANSVAVVHAGAEREEEALALRR
jgi:signal transduction histidine kinase